MLDHDAEQVEAVRRFGWRVFYGDATRLDLLRTAGAAKARVLVLAIDDVEQSLEWSTLVREHFPQLHDRGARAQRARTTTRCASAACTLIERETLDSALMSARSVLELMGWQPHSARKLALRFRRHSIELMERDGAALRRREAADRAWPRKGASSSRSWSRRSASWPSARGGRAGGRAAAPSGRGRLAQTVPRSLSPVSNMPAETSR